MEHLVKRCGLRTGEGGRQCRPLPLADYAIDEADQQLLDVLVPSVGAFLQLYQEVPDVGLPAVEAVHPALVKDVNFLLSGTREPAQLGGRGTLGAASASARPR